MKNKYDFSKLIGRMCYAKGYCAPIVGVHVYYSKRGALSVRVHLKDINGYFVLGDCILL